jgi:DNA-binding NarL/FixJ family response regulator
MKILLVDDDPLILKSLSLSLSRQSGIEVIGTAADGGEALSFCDRRQPDIALMDINMPGVDGIAATRLIKERYPGIKVMILTTFADKANIGQALSAGADGYLVKTDKVSDLAIKLRAVAEGAGVLGADVLRTLAQKENPALANLTPREKDIARLVAQGLKNKDIAEQLFLSEGTVRNNIVVIMEKFNVSNRTQLGMAYYDG